MARTWTDGNIQAAAKLWNDGQSSAEISAALGVSRNSVISLANRNKDMFRAKSRSEAAILSAKNRAAHASTYRPAKPKVMPNWNTVLLTPKRPVVQKPLKDMMADWIAENGPPRRFDRGFSGDWTYLCVKMEELGWKLNKQANWYTLGPIGSKGRPKRLRRDGVLEKIDAILIANGKQPFLPRQIVQQAVAA